MALISSIVRSTSSSPITFQNSSSTEIGTLCRAWVNFNGGNVLSAPSIRANFNVSSITDNGTGNYTVNFTTALSDADYVGVFGCNDNGNITSMNYRTAGTKTTTAFQVSTTAAGPTLTDNNMAMVAIFR